MISFSFTYFPSIFLVTFAIILCCHAQSFDPYQLGSNNVTRLDIRRLTTSGLQMNLDVWAPTEGGNASVVFYLDAFGAIIPGEAYEQVMSHISSHGFVVVLSWRFSTTMGPLQKVPLVQNVIDWCKENLRESLLEEGVHDSLIIDFNRAIGGSHSAGSHILVEYLKQGCGDFKGLIYMSPVDGVDPYGQIDNFCITPGEYLNFDIPTYLLAGGLDEIPGISGIACAPDFLSNRRFWNATRPTSPRWFVNATEFGHGDCLDESYYNIMDAAQFCVTNEIATAEDFEEFRRFTAGQIVSFSKAVLESDCSTYLPYLEDTSTIPVVAINEYNNLGGCPSAFCNWQPLPSTTSPVGTDGTGV